MTIPEQDLPAVEPSPTTSDEQPTPYILNLETLCQSERDHRAWEYCQRLAQQLNTDGGQAMLVGGCVRDAVCGKQPKDFDIEVHQVVPECLRATLSEFAQQHGGHLNEVGASFGIIKLSLPDGIELDISLPRLENSTGAGHRDFTIATDPWMGLKEAASRRDFTINALALDLATGEVHDHFGGLTDLTHKTLKVTNTNKFREDPLRVLRAMQFAARLELTATPETITIMQDLLPTLKTISGERQREEWSKLLLKAERPSVGLEAAKNWGVLKELYPTLATLETIDQDERWHPEGNVWQHTMLAVDQAAQYLQEQEFTTDQALTIMLATLCHDLGKITTTTKDADGHIRSLGHDVAGADFTPTLLQQMGFGKTMIEKATKLVVNHMSLINLYQAKDQLKPSAIRRLATRLFPASIPEFVAVTRADHLGRGAGTDILPDYPQGTWLLEQVQQLGIGEGEKPAPIIRGRDLIALGLQPGCSFGTIIAISEELNYLGLAQEEILALIRPQIVPEDPLPEPVITTLQKELIARSGEINY